MPIGVSGNEWTIGARAGLEARRWTWPWAGGIRAYFGEDRFKTYLTAEVAVHIVPNVTAGPRLGFGIQYDFLPAVGVYLGGAAEVAAGQGIRSPEPSLPVSSSARTSSSDPRQLRERPGPDADPGGPALGGRGMGLVSSPRWAASSPSPRSRRAGASWAPMSQSCRWLDPEN